MSYVTTGIINEQDSIFACSNSYTVVSACKSSQVQRGFLSVGLFIVGNVAIQFQGLVTAESFLKLSRALRWVSMSM